MVSHGDERYSVYMRVDNASSKGDGYGMDGEGGQGGGGGAGGDDCGFPIGKLKLSGQTGKRTTEFKKGQKPEEYACECRDTCDGYQVWLLNIKKRQCECYDMEKKGKAATKPVKKGKKA